MEIHAHSHTARKKWTHYFWEFLMLFLAVFCGFLAENQREHMVERRRVKESMKEVVENLKYDTVRCRINAESNVENNYRQSNRIIESKILNIPSFDRGEASNLILFYKQMLVSTRTLQLNNYIQTNHKILEVLRDNYSIKNE